MKDMIGNIICVGTAVLYVGVLCSIFIGICIGAFTHDKQNKQPRN